MSRLGACPFAVLDGRVPGADEGQPAGHPHTVAVRVLGSGIVAVATGYAPLVDDAPEFARTMAASVQQVRRIGSGFGREGEVPTLPGPRCASVQGFSLHLLLRRTSPRARRVAWETWLSGARVFPSTRPAVARVPHPMPCLRPARAHLSLRPGSSAPPRGGALAGASFLVKPMALLVVSL